MIDSLQTLLGSTARWRVPVAFPRILTLALLVALAPAVMLPAVVHAHAPAIAVTKFSQPLLESPTLDSIVLMELDAGVEMELTGHASGDFVEVIAGGITGWVDVNLIRAGQIQTATVSVLTPITAEPNDAGQLLTLVPAGDTVILTGAAVDGYLAGSYNGTGGWLPAANLD
jgi:hypothetical protein